MSDQPFPSSTPPEASNHRIPATGRKYALPEAKRERSGSLLVNPPYLDKARVGAELCEHPLVTLYPTGARIHWRFSASGSKAGRVASKRGPIKDLSHKARLNAAFHFSNAPDPWEWMITLTRRRQPRNPKADFDKFTRAMRNTWDCACQWGWIMEYQRRRVVHHHIFLSSTFVDRNFCRSDLEYRTVVRSGQSTTLVAGAFDSWVVDEWVSAMGDTSKACRAFQEGGVVEVFRLPDAAARYIAKEAGKRCQKQLPKGVDGGHRWWWLSPHGKPLSQGTARLTHYPFETLVSRVFDKVALQPFLIANDAVFAKPAKSWVDMDLGF